MAKGLAGPQQMRFYRFTGNGSSFSMASTVHSFDPATVENHMTVGDFDNDGQLDDAAVARAGGLGVQLYVFPSGGTSGPSSWLNENLDITDYEGRMAVANL